VRLSAGIEWLLKQQRLTPEPKPLEEPIRVKVRQRGIVVDKGSEATIKVVYLRPRKKKG